MKRGEIWWAELPVPSGSEPGFRRPVAVVQADVLNRSRIRTVIVTAITSNIDLAAAPGNVLLLPEESGLSKESLVNVTQLFTLDRSRLIERAGALPAGAMHALEDGLRLSLSL
ncbi:MAG: type II toxin-antitoxin system PemK/MazF family toxin [Planctomycetes bacterium]|nr:type II toxin-antitoxin system PemK/MazF family toxin [Planctomycetota bacterium]